MRQRSLGYYSTSSSGGGALPASVAANAWAAAVVANGGTVSAGRLTLITTMISALIAAGTWPLLDDMWLLVAENAPSALTSLRQLRLATVTAAPTFTTDRGYAFNGTTQIIDTGFIPNTMATASTFTNQRIEVYERANVTTLTNSGGGTIVTNGSQIRACSGTTRMTASLSSGLTNLTLLSTSSLGLTSASRNDATSTPLIAGYRNAVAVTPVSAPSSGTTLSAVSLYIGATNANGTIGSARATTIGLMSVGASFSQAQETAHYNAIQAFMTSVGANV